MNIKFLAEQKIEFDNAIAVLVKYSNKLNDKGYIAEYLITDAEIIAVMKKSTGEILVELPLIANNYKNKFLLERYCKALINEDYEYNRKQSDSFHSRFNY